MVVLGPISLAFLSASSSLRAFSSCSSRCRSYPSCLIRSASSRAFRSASAKLTGFAFDAPRPSFDFFGAAEEDVEDAEFNLDVPLPRRAGRAAAEEVMVRAAGGLVVVVVVVVKVVDPDAAEVELDTEGVRPIMGGVAMRGVPGAEVLGVVGFDQESKKSSSVSSFAAGVD